MAFTTDCAGLIDGQPHYGISQEDECGNCNCATDIGSGYFENICFYGGGMATWSTGGPEEDWHPDGHANAEDHINYKTLSECQAGIASNACDVCTPNHYCNWHGADPNTQYGAVGVRCSGGEDEVAQIDLWPILHEICRVGLEDLADEGYYYRASNYTCSEQTHRDAHRTGIGQHTANNTDILMSSYFEYWTPIDGSGAAQLNDPTNCLDSPGGYNDSDNFTWVETIQCQLVNSIVEVGTCIDPNEVPECIEDDFGFWCEDTEELGCGCYNDPPDSCNMCPPDYGGCNEPGCSCDTCDETHGNNACNWPNCDKFMDCTGVPVTGCTCDVDDIYHDSCNVIQDECNVCGGNGTSDFQCSTNNGDGTFTCWDMAENECDCDGNQLDCFGECGGPALDEGCGCFEEAPKTFYLDQNYDCVVNIDNLNLENPGDCDVTEDISRLFCKQISNMTDNTCHPDIMGWDSTANTTDCIYPSLYLDQWVYCGEDDEDCNFEGDGPPAGTSTVPILGCLDPNAKICTDDTFLEPEGCYNPNATIGNIPDYCEYNHEIGDVIIRHKFTYLSEYDKLAYLIGDEEQTYYVNCYDSNGNEITANVPMELITSWNYQEIYYRGVCTTDGHETIKYNFYVDYAEPTDLFPCNLGGWPSEMLTVEACEDAGGTASGNHVYDHITHDIIVDSKIPTYVGFPNGDGIKYFYDYEGQFNDRGTTLPLITIDLNDNTLDIRKGEIDELNYLTDDSVNTFEITYEPDSIAGPYGTYEPDSLWYKSNYNITSTDTPQLESIGMDSIDNWYLDSLYQDKTSIKNALMYDLWKQMDVGYTFDYRFVDLTMNSDINEYRGTYLLREEITPERLEVSEDGFATRFIIDRTDCGCITPGQSCEEELTITTENIYGDVNDIPGHWEGPVNLPSFARFIIFNELSLNPNGYNNFIVYGDDLEDIHFAITEDFSDGFKSLYESFPGTSHTHLHAGFPNPVNVLESEYSGWAYKTAHCGICAWGCFGLHPILQHIGTDYDSWITGNGSAVEQAIQSTWNELRGDILNVENIYNRIDYYHNYLKTSMFIDNKRWNYLEYEIYETYEDVINSFKEWIANRIYYIDKSLLWGTCCNDPGASNYDSSCNYNSGDCEYSGEKTITFELNTIYVNDPSPVRVELEILKKSDGNTFQLKQVNEKYDLEKLRNNLWTITLPVSKLVNEGGNHPEFVSEGYTIEYHFIKHVPSVYSVESGAIEYDKSRTFVVGYEPDIILSHYFNDFIDNFERTNLPIIKIDTINYNDMGWVSDDNPNLWYCPGYINERGIIDGWDIDGPPFSATACNHQVDYIDENNLYAGYYLDKTSCEINTICDVDCIDGTNLWDEPKVSGWMDLIYNGEDTIHHRNDVPQLSTKIGIEARGFSSRGFPKKQYAIETQQSYAFPQCADENANYNLFCNGFAPEEDDERNEDCLFTIENDFVLLGPYRDRVYIRNALTYELWDDMGNPSSNSKHVEFVLNGVYQGIFVVFEKPKADDYRMNVGDGLECNFFYDGPPTCTEDDEFATCTPPGFDSANDWGDCDDDECGDPLPTISKCNDDECIDTDSAMDVKKIKVKGGGDLRARTTVNHGLNLGDIVVFNTDNFESIMTGTYYVCDSAGDYDNNDLNLCCHPDSPQASACFTEIECPGETVDYEDSLYCCTGGYIVKIESGGEQEYFVMTDGFTKVEYYDPDEWDTELGEVVAKTFIKSKVERITKNNGSNYLDATSFADYFISQELAQNNEGYTRSQYWMMNDGDYDTFYQGYVWDMNHAYGAVIDYSSYWSFLEFFAVGDVWTGWIGNNHDVIYDNWVNYRSNILDVNNLLERIDNLSEPFKSYNSIIRDSNRWFYSNTQDYDDEIRRFKGWLFSRIAFMDAMMCNDGGNKSIYPYEQGDGSSTLPFDEPSIFSDEDSVIDCIFNNDFDKSFLFVTSPENNKVFDVKDTKFIEFNWISSVDLWLMAYSDDELSSSYAQNIYSGESIVTFEIKDSITHELVYLFASTDISGFSKFDIPSYFWNLSKYEDITGSYYIRGFYKYFENDVAQTIFSNKSYFSIESTTEKRGCTDPLAINYNEFAVVDDGNCKYQSDCDEKYLVERLDLQSLRTFNISPGYNILSYPFTYTLEDVEFFDVLDNSYISYDGSGFSEFDSVTTQFEGKLYSATYINGNWNSTNSDGLNINNMEPGMGIILETARSGTISWTLPGREIE